jgi:hypothetical protein
MKQTIQRSVSGLLSHFVPVRLGDCTLDEREEA